MVDATEEVKAALTFKKVVRQMEHARSSMRPKTPPTLDVLVENFENDVYPERFQKLYQGYVKKKIAGIVLSPG